jgi:hypothetical protein
MHNVLKTQFLTLVGIILACVLGTPLFAETNLERLQTAYDQKDRAVSTVHLLLGTMIDGQKARSVQTDLTRLILSNGEAQKDLHTILLELAALKKNPAFNGNLNPARLKRVRIMPEFFASQLMRDMIEFNSPPLWMNGAQILQDLKLLTSESNAGFYEAYVYETLMKGLEEFKPPVERVFSAFMLTKLKENNFYPQKLTHERIKQIFKPMQYDQLAAVRNIAEYALNNIGSLPFMLVNCVSMSAGFSSRR